MARDDRRTGKTTWLFEEAVRLLAEIPEDAYVFITGAHSRWLWDLERSFKKAGLEDVIFLSVEKIKQGALRGRKGVLLIDDFGDLNPEEQMHLSNEQQRLKMSLKGVR